MEAAEACVREESTISSSDGWYLLGVFGLGLEAPQKCNIRHFDARLPCLAVRVVAFAIVSMPLSHMSKA